jgi:predicted O-methyltransferase YrrM
VRGALSPARRLPGTALGIAVKTRERRPGVSAGRLTVHSPRARLSFPAMNHDLWTAVDSYICEHLLTPDPVLEAALVASEAAGLPPIAITPNQGKLLELLARIHNAHSILELGTLGGYSTIWLARALQEGGHLITLERDPRYAEVARMNVSSAGVADVVQIRVGPALQTLPELHDEGVGPFDMIFIDADKQNYPGYLEWSLKLSRVGTLIIGDNVVRAGAILDPNAEDPSFGDGGIAAGVRCFYELLAAEPRVSATAIQTVGAKGHDGFALALVTGP